MFFSKKMGLICSSVSHKMCQGEEDHPLVPSKIGIYVFASYA
jgi:hypothetical protein